VFFAEDALDGFRAENASPSTNYILVKDFRADLVGFTFSSMELNFACINWVSSFSAKVQISPDVVGVTSTIHPRTDDLVDSAHGCLSSSGMVLFPACSLRSIVYLLFRYITFAQTWTYLVFALLGFFYPLVLSLILNPPILVLGSGMSGSLSLAALVIGLSLWSFLLELWKEVSLLPLYDFLLVYQRLYCL
jgi:hypothetical protein